jgi:hypothetical protein
MQAVLIKPMNRANKPHKNSTIAHPVMIELHSCETVI